MCGIFGVFRPGGLRREDRWLLRHMSDSMFHRGPDGEGFRVEDTFGVGMRRLAIMDPAGGWQPLTSEDGEIIVVANGEIYNAPELREWLETAGHRFRTRSDCETIVHLYEEHGSDCVHQLRGMFAFALIDRRRGKLLLARDRMGEKPLILAEHGERFVFCSELASLVGAGALPIDIDPDAIKMFYYWGYIPEPMCPIRGARKLPAGSILEIDLVSGQRDERVYWRLEDSPPVEGDAVERIRAELEVIGRITMRSDVPLGVGLSAGIDSSAIAAIAKAHANQPVSAFSVGYEGKAWQDESGLAADFARDLGIPFHRVEVRTDRVIDDFPHMCLRRDEPIVDLSGSNIFALMQATNAAGVRVLLSGLGGDELFWGYDWHRRSVEYSERKRRMLSGQSSVIDYLTVRPPPISLTGLINWIEDAGGLRAGLRAWRRDAASDPNRLVFWDEVRDFRTAERRLAMVSGDSLRASSLSPARCFTGESYWKDLDVAMTERICSTYLRCNGLNQTDRLSMACSVEARVPFVDYRFAELAVGIRKVRTDRDLGHKYLLREALRGIVPDEVMRRRKRGFTPPWRIWIRRLMDRYGEQMVTGEVVAHGLITASSAQRFRRGFDLAGRIEPFALETLVLEQWIRGMSTLARMAPRERASDEPSLPARGTREPEHPRR